MTTLAEYPPTAYNVDEFTDVAEVADLLNSKGVTCWAQGVIAGTDYFKLVHTSPATKGDKPFIGVAKTALVNEARRLVAR